MASPHQKHPLPKVASCVSDDADVAVAAVRAVLLVCSSVRQDERVSEEAKSKGRSMRGIIGSSYRVGGSVRHLS